MKYALLIYSPATAEEYAAAATAGRQAAPGRGPWTDYTQAAKDAGVLLGAEQLTHTETATSVRFAGEDRLITDGPFMETKEHLLGFYLIDVPGLDEALEWAARLPMIGYATVEVRAARTGADWQAVMNE
jgi:hypothetical protein